MAHPSSRVPSGTLLWFGPEVEGQAMRGVFTAFVAAPLDGEWLDAYLLRLRDGTVRHVFLTETFGDYAFAWDWLYEFLIPLIEGVVPVTVACYSAHAAGLLFAPWAPQVRFLVRASTDAGWIRLLRPNDEVSVGVDYDLLTWRTIDGIRSRPEDYKGDAS